MRADELRTTWYARDTRYAVSKATLDEDAIASVRSWRMGEASRLRPEVRGDAMDEAQYWTPPPRINR